MSGEQTAELALIKKQEAEILMEGNEFVRLYADTGKILFSVATLPPGQKGMLDPGHQGAHEIAYVVNGSLVFEFPDSKKWFELEEGDAVLIPEGEPHLVSNIGDETGTIIWALAPDLGRPWLTK